MNYNRPKRDEPNPDLQADVEEALKKIPPSTPEPSPVNGGGSGAEQLVAAAEKAISGAYDAVIEHVDEMISKLQSVKESIRAKRDGAVGQLKEFVNLAALGLNSVRDLDNKVKELIKNHLSE